MDQTPRVFQARGWWSVIEGTSRWPWTIGLGVVQRNQDTPGIPQRFLCCENQSGSKKTIGLEGKVKAAPKRQLSTTEAHRLLVDVQAGAGISAGLMVYKGVPIVFGYTRGPSVARINREKKSTSVPKKYLT